MRRSRDRAMRACFAALATCAVFPAAGLAATSYTPGTPAVDGVLNGPWNTSQGDTAGAPYSGNPFGPLSSNQSLLFPTYTPGGTALSGAPNLAVYPGTGTTPYPSGVVGTPGPLDSYCGSGNAATERTGTPMSEPANTDLPMAPYYFPDIVRNADGSLTGYFDWRPKDADEAITVAKSTDGGLTWNTEGEALEQNPGYCPSADTNDDGEGHPYVMSVPAANGGTGGSYLYTLQRSAGDNTGIGMLVHSLSSATPANPLNGQPATEPSGVDGNAFATASVSVPTSGGVAIPLSTLGTSGSMENLAGGTAAAPAEYVDDTVNPPASLSGARPTVISCTGTATSPAPELTGCTASAAITVSTNDDIVDVIGNVTTAVAIPASTTQVPGGSAGVTLAFGSKTAPNYGNAVVSPLMLYTMNNNAPNRVYVDGYPVYCNQANANPTTQVSSCTTPAESGSATLSVAVGDVVTADPIDPAKTLGADPSGQPNVPVTSGLIAPDGIVGSVPASAWASQGAPGNSTVVLYTEKLLGYFIEGTTNGSVSSGGTFSSATFALPHATINYQPSIFAHEALPSSGSFTLYIGSSAGSIQTLTCTGWTSSVPSAAPSGSVDLTGCTGGTGNVATGSSGNWIGGPGAAINTNAVLGQTGEGNGTKSAATQQQKLFGNNEDYTVLRAAWTTDGYTFHDMGALSGQASASGVDAGSGVTSTSYNDISNPFQQQSPISTSDPVDAGIGTVTGPTSMSAGALDAVELRWVGSRGTIITNPDGSLGMFLSGAWASDGDSDAFNQTFYTTSTDGGHTWTVPKVVVGTDYSFSASYAQNPTGTAPVASPLGISAYYSGRAYGPTVVQNPDGSVTMVFAGYRLPKPITTAGTKLGTNASAQYTVGTTDPALYRNILTMTLTSATSPAVGTSSSVATSLSPAPWATLVTYTDTVTSTTGDGTPTGTVSFSAGGTKIATCQNVPLSSGVAVCGVVPNLGTQTITATYSGDSNYASSAGTVSQTENAPALPGCSVTSTIHSVNGQETAGDQQQVTLQAPGGLASVQNVFIDNGMVMVPGFTPGTTSPITVTATKDTSGRTTYWTFTATDEAGQTQFCG